MNWLNWKDIEVEPIDFLKTGTVIDTVCGGIVRGTMTVISGSTGNGKSMFAAQLAYFMSQHHKVAYLSMENTKNEDLKRFSSFERQFGFTAKFNYARELIGIKDLEVPADTEVLFIDSFDFMLENSMDGVLQNGFQSSVACNELSKRLIEFAETNNVAIVVVVQLNTEAERSELWELLPSNIKGGYTISQKATHIWAIQNKNGFKIKMLKNRIGTKDNDIYMVNGGPADRRLDLTKDSKFETINIKGKR